MRVTASTIWKSDDKVRLDCRAGPSIPCQRRDLIRWLGQHIDDLNSLRLSSVCVSQADRTDAIIQTTIVFTKRFIVAGHSYRLLGTLRIEEDGQSAALIRSPIGCALVTYLIVTGEPQSREVVASLFWDDTSTSNSLRNLRSLLNRIHKWAPELSIMGSLLAFQPGLNTNVDLLQLREALAGDDLTALDSTLRLYRGDLLEGFYLQDSPRFEEWLLLARERLRQQVLEAHNRLCQTYR